MNRKEQDSDMTGEVRCVKAKRRGWIDCLVIGVVIVMLACTLEAAFTLVRTFQCAQVIPNPVAKELVSFVEEGRDAPNPECRGNAITARVALGYLVTREDLATIKSYCRWSEKGSMPAPVLSELETKQLDEQRLYLELKGPEKTSRVQY